MALFSNIQEPTRNDKVAVGVTSISISSASNDVNPRKTIIIRNTSPNATDIITVNFGYTPATAQFGIVLNQNESVADTSETGYTSYQGVITAICATVTGQVSIFER